MSFFPLSTTSFLDLKTTRGKRISLPAVRKPKDRHPVRVGDPFLNGPSHSVNQVLGHPPAPLSGARRDKRAPKAAAAAEVDLEDRGAQVGDSLHGGREPEAIAGPGLGPDDDDERQGSRARERGVSRFVGCYPGRRQRDVRRQKLSVAGFDFVSLLGGELVLVQAGELLNFGFCCCLKRKVRERKERKKEKKLDRTSKVKKTKNSKTSSLP